jgi:hypothetical protein
MNGSYCSGEFTLLAVALCPEYDCHDRYGKPKYIELDGGRIRLDGGRIKLDGGRIGPDGGLKSANSAQLELL